VTENDFEQLSATELVAETLPWAVFRIITY